MEKIEGWIPNCVGAALVAIGYVNADGWYNPNKIFDEFEKVSPKKAEIAISYSVISIGFFRRQKIVEHVVALNPDNHSLVIHRECPGAAITYNVPFYEAIGFRKSLFKERIMFIRRKVK